MLSYGSKEYLEGEAYRLTGPLRFVCPECEAKPFNFCTRKGGYAQMTRLHKARVALWVEYARSAPVRLAWLQSMALPWFELTIKEYLIGGKRPKRRRVDVQIAEKRLEEMRSLLGGA